MQKIVLLFGFLLFLLLSFPTFEASARSTVCDLQVKVFESSNKENLKNIKLRLLNFDNFKVLKTDSEDGINTFNDLNKGKYRLEVEKNGFKTSVKGINLTCEKKLAVEKITLWNGKSSDKIFLLEDDSQLTASGEYFFEKDFSLVTISLPFPSYNKKCSSDCEVKVLQFVDENGDVISAQALTGQPFLHKSAERAARNSKFFPVVYKGKPVKVKGITIYNFN